jgi:hypothetical protein
MCRAFNASGSPAQLLLPEFQAPDATNIHYIDDVYQVNSNQSWFSHVECPGNEARRRKTVVIVFTRV